MLDKTEEDKDMSWECCKIADYFKEKSDVKSSNHNVWWNGMISIRLNHG
jgi:hypothetical protein